MNMKTKMFITICAIGAIIQLSARIIVLPPAEFEVGGRTLDTATYAPFLRPPQQFEQLVATTHPHHPFYLSEVVTNATGILNYTYFAATTLAQIIRPGMNAINPVNHEPIIRINSYYFNTPWLPIFEQTMRFSQPAGSAHHVSHTSPHHNHTPAQGDPARHASFAQSVFDKLIECQRNVKSSPFCKVKSSGFELRKRLHQ